MRVAIVKYNAGNIQSVRFALERLGLEGNWTDDPEALRTADKVIFPGQGEAASAMRYLRERGLDTVIAGLQQPVLGICIGLQLFCRHSDERDTPCIGVFDTAVKKFSGVDGIKVPQMGWNQIHHLNTPLFEGVPEGSYVYFVHSYYAENDPHAIALADYGETFSAALRRDNFYAVQFHPEKSGAVGQRILQNFLKNC
jgi:imidazole glycerol-phosphate synthase subunit HisH